MPAPDDPFALAETEKGRTLTNFTFSDVETSLRMLILQGGNVKGTVRLLAESGIVVSTEMLKGWRDSSFAERYREIRYEISPQVAEEVAGRALERALQADDAEAAYIEAAYEKIGEVSPDKLAGNALALARAKGENIDKARLLRNQPTEIKEVRDTAELLDVLRRAGVLARDPQFDLEGHAEEVQALHSQPEGPTSTQTS